VISGIPAWRIVEDLEIVILVRNGDIDAFSQLVEKYHRNLLGFIYRIVRRPEIVEDIGQEVFLSAYQSLENFDAARGVPFSAWLFTIAKNRCISEVRKQKTRREEPLEDTITGNDDSAEHEESKRALESALSILEEPFRSAILNNLEGLSIGEIAAKDRVPPATVKTRLYRAREKLRRLLGVRPEGEML
jgi:RNA polymerase sigma-70 factor (ECF subfamily)